MSVTPSADKTALTNVGGVWSVGVTETEVDGDETPAALTAFK